ncbi:MAG: hypothetical protein ACRDTE_25410 [Pseudonocardiaceae bacterium]
MAPTGGSDTQPYSAYLGEDRRIWEKIVDVYDNVDYQFQRVMNHPVGKFAVEQLSNVVARKAGTSIANAHTRHQQRKYRAALPPGSPWKVQDEKHLGGAFTL